MWNDILKTALTAKSLMGLGVAYEFAVAGRVLAGLLVAVAGVSPHLWSFAKRFVESPVEPERFDWDQR
jgi:hypothetical protein